MKRSIFFSLGTAIAVIVWILSGYISGVEPEIKKPAVVLAENNKIPTVRIRRFEVKEFQENLEFSATTALDSRVKISSQAEGRVVRVLFDENDKIVADQPLVLLETDTQDVKLAEATAAFDQAQANFRAAQEMVERGFSSRNSLLGKETLLKQASATLKQAQQASNKLEVLATAAGQVENRLVEVGQYITLGTVVAELVQLDKLKFRAEISERDLGKIKMDTEVSAKTVTGGTYRGKVTYISAIANPATRTFEIEVTADNAGDMVVEGMTASLLFTLPPQGAHLLPSSLLSLNDKGEVGIKVVESERVEFHPISLLSATSEGVWVRGLPASFDLIIVGQEFVSVGQSVVSVSEEEIERQVRERTGKAFSSLRKKAGAGGSVPEKEQLS